MPTGIEEEEARLRTLLAAAVKFSNRKQRHVEAALGVSTGMLSRLFAGGIELKIKHVIGICGAIGLPLGVFFAAAFPEAGNEPTPYVAQLHRLLLQLHPANDLPQQHKPSPTPERTPPASPQEIERMVHAALSRYFSSMAQTASSSGQ